MPNFPRRLARRVIWRGRVVAGRLAGKVAPGFARRAGCWAAVLLLGVAASQCGCSWLHRTQQTQTIVNARQMSMRGVDALEKQRHEEAEEYFRKAVELCPVDERAHQRYAEALWRRGERALALGHMEKAVKLSAGAPELEVELGEMCLAQGDLVSAGRRADNAIRRSRELASAWALQAEVLRRQGQPEEALACYQRALSHQPHYPQAQLAASEVYREQGRPHRALAVLQNLVDQYPPEQAPANVLLRQGLAYKELGRHDDAVDSLAMAARRGEPSDELLFHLGEARLLAGDVANARLSVLALLERAPQHAAGARLLENIDRQQHQMSAALTPPAGRTWTRE